MMFLKNLLKAILGTAIIGGTTWIAMQLDPGPELLQYRPLETSAIGFGIYHVLVVGFILWMHTRHQMSYSGGQLVLVVIFLIASMANVGANAEQFFSTPLMMGTQLFYIAVVLLMVFVAKDQSMIHASRPRRTSWPPQPDQEEDSDQHD